MMFGTASNTYTMPGIISDASRAAQTGPLELVTSDANGNLATDGGSLLSVLRSEIAANEARLDAAETRLLSTENVLGDPSILPTGSNNIVDELVDSKERLAGAEADLLDAQKILEAPALCSMVTNSRAKSRPIPMPSGR